MPDLPASRRNFLALAGAGIAAAGAAVALPRVAGGSSLPVQEAVKALPDDVESSIMAIVHDVHDGVVTIMVAGREVEITDRALVSKLAHAASGSTL